jgi:hypothetical protein
LRLDPDLQFEAAGVGHPLATAAREATQDATG